MKIFILLVQFLTDIIMTSLRNSKSNTTGEVKSSLRLACLMMQCDDDDEHTLARTDAIMGCVLSEVRMILSRVMAILIYRISHYLDIGYLYLQSN